MENTELYTAKVSVIIPVYNVEEFLGECLESLQRQTLKEVEFICINDGSTDDSLKILNKYAQNDKRFIIISQTNQGQGVARNEGIKIAKGEFISFVDADDWLESDALETLYRYAKEQKSKVVHFNYSEFNNHSKKFKHRSFAKKVKKDHGLNLIKNNSYNWRELKNGCLSKLDMHVWSHFYDSKFIKENNIKFSPNRRSEDHLFVISTTLLAKKISYLNKTLYFYRCRKGSAVNSRGNDSFCIFDNIAQIKNIIIKNNLWNELEKEFNNYQKMVLSIHYRQTPLDKISRYENECRKILNKKDYKDMLIKAKNKRNFFENIFSLKNKKENAKKYKVLTIFGIEFIFKPKENSKINQIEQKPLISIIIPVYNAQNTLNRCLESLIYQTYSNIEILCVDDGSSDSSREILNDFIKKDSRIKAFFIKNSGPAKARNLALNNAYGKYIMFCDSDDSYCADMVEKMLNALIGKNVDFVMCDCNIIDITKNSKTSELSDYHKLHLKGFAEISSKNIKDINVVLWNKIFKKDLIDKNKITYPEKFEHDDVVFVYKYMLCTKTYYGLNLPLYNYTLGNPDSIMGRVYAKTNSKSKYDFIFAWQNFYDFLKSIQLNKKLKNYFIKLSFEKIRFFYSLLDFDERKQSFIYIKELINKNPEILKNNYFKKLATETDFNSFHKLFFFYDSKLTFFQRIFSIKNSPDNIHKIIRILGIKFNLRRINNEN